MNHYHILARRMKSPSLSLFQGYEGRDSTHTVTVATLESCNSIIQPAATGWMSWSDDAIQRASHEFGYLVHYDEGI